MRVVTVNTGIVEIGHEGENLAVEVRFPIETYMEGVESGGTWQLVAQRHTDTEPYPVSVNIVGDYVSWLVSNADTAIPGIGKCELRYILDDVLAKSIIFSTLVTTSIGTESATPPAPWQSWVDTVLEAGSAATQSATASAESASASAESASASAESASAAAGSAAAASDSASSASSSASSAASSADAAEQSAMSMAFVSFNLDPSSGDLIMQNSQLLGTTHFALTGDGNLEVTI